MGKEWGSEPLGSLYTTGKVRNRREWRGFKDTFYDYTRWLHIMGILSKFIVKPRNIKAFFRYRWMANYLAVPMMVDRHTQGLRDEYLRICHLEQDLVIEDVAKLKSEIGVLYLNQFNENVLRKTFKEHNLKFERLFLAKPHVFVGSGNPLAKREKITLQDLEPYPRLSYEQGDHNAFYFSEEILSTLESRKDIRVCDRATLFNLLIGLNGYTICSGVINETLNGRDIVAVPLEADDYMEIGYITHKQVVPGKFAMHYIEALKRFAVD